MKMTSDPRIDVLREKITCVEDPSFTANYHDPNKRSIANAITIELNDGTILDEVVVEYPIGHARRRKEGIPLLIEKYRKNLSRIFSSGQQRNIELATLTRDSLERMPVPDFMELFIPR
jgi:2-methylcitrate dehydratase